MPYDTASHHRRSIRLHGYDYSKAGLYFVTLCTFRRELLFGEIGADGEMRLNDFGRIAQEEWLRSNDIRQEIELDEWIIMPNHIHGIVVITPNDHAVGATGLSPLRPMHQAPPQQRRPHGPTRRSLGSFIGGFKSAVTVRINQMRGTTGAAVWQRNYFEHIIRNEGELDAIRAYIASNPAHWLHDRDHAMNSRRPTTKAYMRDVARYARASASAHGRD